MKARSWAALGAVICAVAVAVVSQRFAIRDAVRSQLGRGELAYQGADDVWREVGRASEARRRWYGPETAFLRGHIGLKPLAEGLDAARIRLRRDPNPQVVTVEALRIEPQQWRFRVLAEPDFGPQSIAQHADSGGVPLAVNASYFADTGPVGLVLQAGEIRVKQGTTWAAHFLVDQGKVIPRIETEKSTPLDGVVEGFQGFPSIMADGLTYPYMRYGNRGFDVHEVARRTAVCVDTEDSVWLVVTDTLANGLTLDELATVMGGLGCEDAMGFDGGSSTALYLELDGHSRRVESRGGIPVALGIERR